MGTSPARRVRRSLLHFVASIPALWLSACVTTAPSEPPPEDPFADRPGTGTATVSGFVESAEGETPLPLGGVKLSLGDAVAFSNVDGSFTLTGVRAGSQQFMVDGTAAQAGDGAYGQFATALTLVEEQELAIERPIYLPFVPLTARRMVVPDAVTTVMSAEGIELEIPPGGARLDGEPYEGEIAILTVAADRTPMVLPVRFDEAARAVVTIQPIGIEFPVAVKLTTPADDTLAGRLSYNTVWSLDRERGDFIGDGVAQHKGDSFVTVAGGIRTSGYHLLTGLQVEVREPCADAETEDDARACLAAASRALEAVQALPTPALPGARTLLGRFDEALRAVAAGLATGSDIVGITSDMYPLALDAVRAYQALYRELPDLEAVLLSAAQVRVACAASGACDPKDGAGVLSQTEAAFEARVATAQDNATKYASRFDRLSAAVAALEPFYTSSETQTSEGSAGFAAAAKEFDAAYRDFAPFASPVDAYDQLVDSLNALERAAREIVGAVSVSAADDAAALLQRVCADRGATSAAAAAGGFAEVRLGESSGRLHDECAVVATDEDRGLSSVPFRETQLFSAIRPPYQLALAGRLADRTLPEGEPQSGTLSEDSPVHRWAVTVEARHGWHAAFESDGPALAGLAVGGVVQLARDGGFEVVNLADVESFSYLVLGTDLRGGGTATYALSGTTMESLFDFAGPVGGSFDVNTRAAAVLFDGSAGDRVVVERPCCDPSGTLFAYSLLEPDGAPATRVDFVRETPGAGDEAFELSQGGLHRVAVSPLTGQFADYEIVVSRASAGEARPIDPGTDTTVVLDEVGATAAYTFVGGAGQIAVIEGLEATGIGQVVYTLIGPDGIAVGRSKPLYFDGSSFATREEALPTEGTYRLIFSSRLSGDALVGTFTFRVTTRNP